MATLTGFDSLYLGDSYLHGFGVLDGVVELRALFCLTRDHPEYEPPRYGEQHCYRKGAIRVLGFKPLELRGAARPPVLRDPDGALDLGSIDVSADADGFRITTEWFEMRFEATCVTAILHPNIY